MHFEFMRDTKKLAMVGIAVLIASCAQQPPKPVPTTSPSPAEIKSAPTQTQTPAALKQKSKPKPPTKPETVEAETPPPAPVEGIEQSKVGYYFDTLQGRLRQLADPNLVVNRQGNQITIDLTRSVHLDGENSAPCTSLAPIAKALVEYRMTRAVIDVAAESGDASSVRLAKSRSESIAKCLADAGVANRRIASNGVPGTASAIRLRIDPIVRNP
jgi:hypothetical protein